MECIEGDSPARSRELRSEIRGIDDDVLTAMYAEYLVVDDHGKRQEVEHVREVRPDMGTAVFPYAFGVEAVCLIHIE